MKKRKRTKFVTTSIENARQQSTIAPFGRVRLPAGRGNFSGALPGPDVRTGEYPPSKSPAAAVMSAAAQSQKPGSGPCRKFVRATCGNADVEDGQRRDSKHQPRHFLGWLAGKHGDEGSCDHEHVRYPARKFRQAEERAVKPEIAGNPFAFALHAQSRKHERSGEQQRVRPSITPRGGMRSCRLC